MDFFNIAKMTEEFRKVKSDMTPNEQILWDLRFKLAIAQQLAVISSTLSKGLEKKSED